MNENLKIDLQDRHSRAIENLNKFRSKKYIFENCLRSIRESFQSIGWYEFFVNDNVKEAQQAFYNASLTVIKGSKLFKNKANTFLDMPRIPLSELALSNSKDLISELSSMDFQLQTGSNKWELFSELIERGESQIYTALLMHSANKDLDSVEELLEIINSKPKAKKKNVWFSDELPFYEGLLTNNKDLITKVIEDLSSPKIHKRTNSYNGIYKELVSFPAIGYAKIAWLNGHEIEIENDLVPNKLLPTNLDLTCENKIDDLIDQMTLESEYKFYNGRKIKERNDVYDTFIFTNPSVNGKDCIQEELIPNIVDFEPNFLGLKTGNKYSKGLQVGTNRKVSSSSIYDSFSENQSIPEANKTKSISILKQYLDDIDELSKTQRGCTVQIDDQLRLETTKSKEKAPKRKGDISKGKKEALIRIGELCLDKTGLEVYSTEINNLKNYDSDEEYGSTLNFLSEKLDECGILLFTQLDWKSEIRHYESIIIQALSQNYSTRLDLDLSSEFPENASISNDGVFKAYNDKLNSVGYETRFVDSESDSYIFLVCKLTDRGELSTWIKKLGFKELTNLY
jgi:hypothetical protein